MVKVALTIISSFIKKTLLLVYKNIALASIIMELTIFSPERYAPSFTAADKYIALSLASMSFPFNFFDQWNVP